MGMDLAPASGYILEVTRYNISKIELGLGVYESLLGEFEVEGELKYHALCRLFNNYPPIDVEVTIKAKVNDLTTVATMMFYTNDDGGEYDDLSDGLYLLFDEGDLFIKEPTYLHMILKEADILPEYKRWTNYG
jgi:hypothetical protein